MGSPQKESEWFDQQGERVQHYSHSARALPGKYRQRKVCTRGELIIWDPQPYIQRYQIHRVPVWNEKKYHISLGSVLLKLT